eukprot:GDKI01036707.1.p1 GENE.GDKI01036707.1~~GDKI01036707.1.p1  ORF type:complete len:156 (-),score=8.40 GDKI01036707.1:174-641(-)
MYLSGDLYFYILTFAMLVWIGSEPGKYLLKKSRPVYCLGAFVSACLIVNQIHTVYMMTLKSERNKPTNDHVCQCGSFRFYDDEEAKQKQFLIYALLRFAIWLMMTVASDNSSSLHHVVNTQLPAHPTPTPLNIPMSLQQRVTSTSRSRNQNVRTC